MEDAANKGGVMATNEVGYLTVEQLRGRVSNPDAERRLIGCIAKVCDGCGLMIHMEPHGQPSGTTENCDRCGGRLWGATLHYHLRGR